MVAISELRDLAAWKHGGRMRHGQEVGKERSLRLATPHIGRDSSRMADRRTLISPTQARVVPRLRLGSALAFSAVAYVENDLAYQLFSRSKTPKKGA